MRPLTSVRSRPTPLPANGCAAARGACPTITTSPGQTVEELAAATAPVAAAVLRNLRREIDRFFRTMVLLAGSRRQNARTITGRRPAYPPGKHFRSPQRF